MRAHGIVMTPPIFNNDPRLATTAKPHQAQARVAEADRLSRGERFRALTVMDVFTREALAIEVGQQLRSHDVVAALERLRHSRGRPESLRRDNGSEFTSQLVDLWAYQDRKSDV